MLRGSLGDIVDLVLAVRVGELLRVGVLDLGEDEGGQGRRLRGCRGSALGEDGGVVRDARTRDGQLNCLLAVEKGDELEERSCWSG